MAAHPKRKLDETDPDYETLEDQQAKRQRALEEDGRQSARRKVQGIIQREFQTEIATKEREFQQVDVRLNEARLMLDRLRACVVANYYGLAGSCTLTQETSEVQSIHPAVKAFIGKAPRNHLAPPEEVNLKDASAHSLSNDDKEAECLESQRAQFSCTDSSQSSSSYENAVPITRVDSPSLNMSSQNPTFDDRRARLKIKRKVIVGNVSKYIPVDQREPNDMSSHKWMIYVRGPKSDPGIDHFVKRVWFFLHHSYKPNDLVEISKPPFHLTRRGWGEFPVRVQLHFLDPRNKKVDIFHHLKLDKTFTGLQKLGGETVVEVELERDSFEECQAPHEKTVPSITQSSSSSTLPSVSSQNKPAVPNDKASLPVSKDASNSNDSETQRLLSADEIKTEPVSLPDELGHQCTEARTKSANENPHTERSGDEFLKEGDLNLKSDACTTITASVPNSDGHPEYNVTISHCNPDERSCRDDQMVDVCGGDEIPVETERSEEDKNSRQSDSVEAKSESIAAVKSLKSQQIQIIPSDNKPAPSSVSANIQPKAAPISISDSPSSTKGPVPVSLISVKELLLRSPHSFLKSSHEHASKLGNPKNISEPDKQRKSASIPVPLSLSSATQPQLAQNGSTPLQTQILNHQNNLNSKDKTSRVNADSGNIQSSFPSGNLPLKSNSLQQFKVITFQKTKADPSPPTMVMKTVPNTATAKIISSRGTVTSVLNPIKKDSSSASPNDKKTTQPVSVLQNEEFKKKALVVHVQPNAAPSQILLKTDKKFVSSAPSVSLFGPQSHKKQVSLLTGLVVDPPKAIQSSNKMSLLRPGACKVEGSNNHGAFGTGIRLDKAKDLIKMAGKTVLINSVPMKDAKSAQMTGIFTPSRTSSFNPPVKRIDSSRAIYRELSTLNVPFPFSTKATSGNSQHNNLDMQHQVFWKGKKIINKGDLIDGTVDIIPPLSLEDFPDLRCLVKAAVKLHPLIRSTVNKLTHPYCARTREQWKSWPVGKQRASEWHRACFVLKYLKLCLNGESQFKGEELMSKRQLVHWCRLHAFSPQSAIFQKSIGEDESSSTIDEGETSLACPNDDLGLKSMTKLKEAECLLDKMENSVEDKERPEDIVVIADEKTITPSSVKKKNVVPDNTKKVLAQMIPKSEGTSFVCEWMRKRGVKFSLNPLENGVVAYTAPNMIYQAMLEFGADIIRRAHCVSAEQGSSTGELSIKDVHRGLLALPEAAFCSNRFLGKEEEEDSDNRFKHEKEIYR